MKKIVWKNKSNNQLCITIPTGSSIREGDIVEVKRASIKKIAYSGVAADLFHYGHLNSIQFAKSISDYNIVGVLTDKAVEEYRAKPIANLQERKSIISSLNCVDRVMVQDSRDPTENLKKIHEEFPNAEIILVHGSDLSYVHGSEYISQIGGKVVQHPYYGRLSTYKIITELIENKDKLKDVIHFESLIKGEVKIDKEYQKGNKVIISTKADTLAALKPLLTKSRIENMFVFSVSDWKNKKDELLKKIKEEFRPFKIAVRSSAVNEDTLDSSMAGYFATELNVGSADSKETEAAVRKVIGSYKHKSSENSFNQVLVQQQTENIAMSGVALTRSLEKNSPYYVVNYDNSTGKSDTVTKGVESRTLKISRFADASSLPGNMQNLLAAVKEIESIIPNIGLDIEFAVNGKSEVIIFQVRPLTTSHKYETDDSEVKSRIDLLKGRFAELSARKPHLAGKRTILADMPDWNPAEIIGDNPNYLDYSLYDYLITDSAWHEARTSQGYYNVNPAKLVVLLGNKPYIDVRNTFNSFVPAALSQKLREKLVDFYLDKLEKNPDMQDKVEFEVLFTCYDMAFGERAEELSKPGFAREDIEELKQALIKLTNSLVVHSKESIKEDLKFLKDMEANRERTRKNSAHYNSVEDMLRNAKFLLDDCRKKGTVEFSRLARLAFVGKIILKSLVRRNVIDENFYDNFMNSVSTVAKEMSKDFMLLGSGAMKHDDFIKKYYHLRPGSYDITSPRYESNPGLLKTLSFDLHDGHSGSFIMDNDAYGRITKVLKQEGLKFDAMQLLEFIKSALEARELSKFQFTKNLSDALELIALAGEEMGFTRQELAMLDVDALLSETNLGREKLTRKWKGIITLRKKERELNNKIEMPPIIFSEKDLDVIAYYAPRPNYITAKNVKAQYYLVINFDGRNVGEIDNKIVLIESGDPGYDWIFTRGIAGLITKYGGVASHMSIRCAEFGIPAAIGCGVVFDNLVSADYIHLDCKSHKIEPIRGA